MRIFVTGATGFVGSHVVAAMRERGHAVACLVRDVEKARQVLGAATAELLAGDLDDAPVLARGCSIADVVVHLAGLTAARKRSELFAINAGGTEALVTAARAATASVRRFVYVSSLAAAGPTENGIVPSSGEEAQPVSDYGRSKLAGEAPVRALAIPWTILRPPAVYGPRDREFLRIFRAARHGVAPLFGDGSQTLSLVYAGDLANAVVRCVEGEPSPGVYYPAHPEITTARALVEGIGTALGKRVRIVHVPRSFVSPLMWITGTAARLAGRATLLSMDKAAELLAAGWTCSPAALEAATGWRARTPLAEGLQQTAAWYRGVGWL